MRRHAQSRAAVLTPMLVGLCFLILQSQPAVSRDCDCSCETYSKFVSGVQEGGGMTPETAELAACYASCVQQWQQCQSQTKAEAEEQTWDCERQPNSPVERRKWNRACGKDTDSGFWASRLGQPRDDLERFYGRYEGADIDWIVAPAKASMEMQDQGRGQIPRGYMMIYAARGDVAPWYMKSVGDARFEATTVTGADVVAEFQVGTDNSASAMILDTEYQDRVRYEHVSGNRE